MLTRKRNEGKKYYYEGVVSLYNCIVSKYSLSSLSILFIALFIFFTDLNSEAYKKSNVIDIDVLAYYAYLPAIFIYQDLTLDYFHNPEYKEILRGKYWFRKGPKDMEVIPVSYGLSLLYSPFFLLAHGFATMLNLEPHGYSWPYNLAIQLAALFYLIIGLILLKRILRAYFTEGVTALTLIAVVLGTNLYYYVSFEAGMSHVYNFFLIVLFLWLLIKWLKNPSFLTTVFLGTVTGFTVLVRPSNLLIISLFLLWDVTDLKLIIHRISFMLRNIHKVLIMIIISLLVWIPQFLYWKYVTGSYVYFSYGDEVGFFWNDPQILNILFSYRKGWLLYTPMMLLAILGIPVLRKRMVGGFIPILTILLLYIYLLSSWCFWWFGGSFGSRGFIDIYGIMALPLATLISYFLTTPKWILKIGFFLIFFFFISHNLFETVQYRNGAIHWGHMTKEAYWASFGHLYPKGNFYDLLKEPPYEEVKQRIEKEKQKEENKGN